MTDENVSKEAFAEDASKHKIDSRFSISSEKSERKLVESPSTTRRDSRRLSRISETITVISDCARAPNTCVLCGSGIPFSKCLNCENEAHVRCIDAFFCTTGRKVNLDQWRCPKCVTMSNMNKESGKEKGKVSRKVESNQVDLLLEIPVVDTECPFCKMDMDHKNCKCRECLGFLQKFPHVQQSQRCSCDQVGKPQMLKYNKCLQYRDFSTKIDYKYLEEEDRFEEEGEVEASIMVRFCWSITWFLLFITFAFPIAVISALIFIIIYCFDACCLGCHPVCCFFLKGIKLPGTCCRGVCSGIPMCSSKYDTGSEKC